jgi:CRP-like cAMP-binding protein
MDAPPATRTAPEPPALTADDAAFWLVCPDLDWSALDEGGRCHDASRETVLCRQGEPSDTVWRVLDGRVRLVRLGPDGDERHVMVIGAGGLVGDTGLWDGGVQLMSAICSSDCRLQAWPAAALRARLATDPALLTQALRLAERRLRVMLQHHALLGNGSAVQRVAHALHGLQALYGRPQADGGRWISVRFTQQEMASICSVSRMSVVSACARLEADGVARREGRHWVVADTARLAGWARGDGARHGGP